MTPPSRRTAVLDAAAALVSTALPAACRDDDAGAGAAKPVPPARRVLVIGHRGASALRPEHTLAAYRKAIEDGADLIEPDLVATRDGHLVARHENEISGTTDVAQRARFADRRATKTIDGVSVTGWFTEDFTLAELKTLRARERIPAQRPDNVQYDGQFDIPTLQEVIALASESSMSSGRVIGIYAETKHPTYFERIGLSLEARLVAALEADPFTARTAAVWIQSFETANLRALREHIGRSRPEWRIVQLMSDASQRPFDFTAASDRRSYADLMSPAGLRQVAAYADAIGPAKGSVLPLDAQGRFLPASGLVRDAHAAGLQVHPYTFRPENAFLPLPLRVAGDAATRNAEGAVKEIRAFLAAGIDGFFTDDPAIGRLAVDGSPR